MTKNGARVSRISGIGLGGETPRGSASALAWGKLARERQF